ncbi:MAG: hypothetical protein AB8G22_23245 [Saprospiraceae bacterium]
MNKNDFELRIVKIKADLGRGVFGTEDVFTEEKITLTLSSKQRMNYIRLPIGALFYAEIAYIDKEARGRYVPTFRDAMSDHPSTRLTYLYEQKKILDAQFIKRFGADEMKINGVY